MRQESRFTLTVSSVEEILFSGEATAVTLPGAKGEFTILANHEPFIALLRKGSVRIKTGDGSRLLSVEKGLCETSNGQVTVLV